MNKYTFYIEGLDREVSEYGNSQKEARQAIWKALSHEERDRVIIFDCIDIERA